MSESVKHELYMTREQKDVFARALDIAYECTQLNQEVRMLCTTKDELIRDKQNEAWVRYQELFRVMKNLIDDAWGNKELVEFFRGSYEVYFNEYTLLKNDVSHLLGVNNVQKYLILPKGQEEDIFTDILTELHVYEGNNIHLLDQMGRDQSQVAKYFTELFTVLRRALMFVKKIFFIAETNDSFSFYLTPFIRVRWLAMTIDSEPSKVEMQALLCFEKWSKDLIGLLAPYHQSMRRDESTSNVKMDFQNKFSSYTASLASFLASKEGLLLNSALTAKAQEVFGDSEEPNKFLTSVTSALSREEIKYKSLARNDFLKVLFNVINNMVDIVSLIDALMPILSHNACELALLVNFIKRFGLKLFLTHCFFKLHLFNEYKRKGLLS